MAQRDEIARLEAMHAANPEGRVFAHLAEAYRKAGEYDRARDVLQAGLQRHPQYASAHVVLGRVLLDVADRSAADASFRRVLELDPHNMVALRARADIAHENGDEAEALRFYRELITLDPSDEQAVLRIAEIESRPAAASKSADEGPAEPGFGDVDLASPPAPSAIAAAPIEETPAVEYGEASLPAVGETSASPVQPEPFEAADFGAVSIDTSAASVPAADSGGDVDLGLGGALEPTDLRTPEPAPDAVVDLSSMGGHFTLPDEGEEPDTGEMDLPGFDEIAADATPEPSLSAELSQRAPTESASAEPMVVPTAPADEPAPAPAGSLPGEVDVVDTKAEFDALWTTYDDGAAAALPDVGPELITETIGDLYAQQGLHERAADVYARLLEGRSGDSGLQAKLDAARAASLSGGATTQPAVAPLPIPKPEPFVEEATPSFAEFSTPEAEPESQASAELETAPVTETEPLPEIEPLAEIEPAATPFAQPEVESLTDAQTEPEAEREAETGTPAFLSALPWEAPSPTALPVPEAPAARELDPFDLPGFATEPEPEPASFDLPGFAATSEPDPFDLPELSSASGSDPFDLPAETAPIDAATAEAASAESTPAGPSVEDDRPIVPIDDLGLEPVGGGDLLVEPATPAQAAAVESPESVEAVESAWTGGAGAAGGTDSPFGWAEPETPSSQATIGEYFDRLVSWTPPADLVPAVATPSEAEPAEAPWAEPAAPAPMAEPAAAEAPPAVPAAIEAAAPEAPAAAPGQPAAATPAPAAADPFDDIDALFGEVATPSTASSLIDDIEALFGAPAPATPAMPAPATPAAATPAAETPAAKTPAPLDMATPAAASPADPPMLPPAVQEPEIAVAADPQVSPAPVEEAGFAWDPFAELAPQAPAASEAPSVAPSAAAPASASQSPAAAAGGGAGFEWDPFAELPEAEAAAPAPVAEAEPATTDEGDDDEDIDMFRAWLQSLKR